MSLADLIHRQLAGNRRLDVSSGLGGKVHHHRAILHAFHHGFGDQDWGLPACKHQAVAETTGKFELVATKDDAHAQRHTANMCFRNFSAT